jgi:gluconolactonase
MRTSSRLAALLIALALDPRYARAQAKKIDLSTREGVAAVKGQWKFHDARIVEVEGKGPDGKPNKTHDIRPRGEQAARPDFDDGGWESIAPESLPKGRSTGLLCFAWYRIKITIPPEAEGKAVFFRTTIDDYGEVWVDGHLPYKVGDSGGPIVAGFNAPNRVELKDARPGKVYQIAVFGINGPISKAPTNWIFLTNTYLDIEDRK